jgi:sporulation protein YlmC with PRC-barrel domain
MIRTFKAAMCGGLVLGTLLAIGNAAQAQVDVEVGPVRVEVENRGSEAEHEIPATRASKIMGMSVKNAEGANLGKINDFMMDLNDGKIRYVALQHGGLVGIGSKLFAIPWKVFQYKRADDGDYLLLNLDEQTFKDAPGFESDNWPEQADDKWLEQIDKYYEEKVRDRRQPDSP